MVYNRFVEAGRIALVNSGKYNEKLVVIVDVITQRRVLCENPVHGVPRQAFNLKSLNLTDHAIKINYGSGTNLIKAEYEKAEIDKKWEQSSWAKRLAARHRRASLNDFERFKVKLAKQRKNRVIKQAVKQLKKEK